MDKKQFSRRMVLRGAAGFTLALPFLPSVAEDDAEAAPDGVARRFVAFATDHGGVWQESMHPSDAALTEQRSYGGHTIRRGALPLDASNGIARISHVLSGDSGVLTPELAAKMNVIRGLDVTFYLAHHRGGHLGNYAENDGNGQDGPMLAHRPTIDQVMAWSDSFYPELTTILERSLVIGANGMSADYSSPSTRSGPVQNITPEQNSLTLFNKIFVPQEDPAEVRPPIVDRVLEDYHRLRESNKRLSSDDRRRLDDHIERVAELQRKLNVALSCGEIEAPTQASTDLYGSDFGINPALQAQFWHLINDVIVAAFACDTCRIVSARVADKFSTFSGDWHQDVAHQANADPGQQQILADAHQQFFEGVFLDLVAKLDALDDGLGNTVLDSTLVQWTQEAGVVTHDPIEMTVVTAGGAGGEISTGSYVDYRDLDKPAHVGDGQGSYANTHIGLVYNQWLGNVAEAMGLQKSEFESGSYGGYGEVFLSTETWYAGYQQYGPQLDVMGEPLPYLRA
jgi:hypothetical protein